jgi:hypothetical protein
MADIHQRSRRCTAVVFVAAAAVAAAAAGTAGASERTAAQAVPPAGATVVPSAHCAYNKTRQLTVVLAGDRSTITLQPGAHMCCKPNDAMCGSQPLASWRIEAAVEGRQSWCGNAPQRGPITLPSGESYLLIRESRGMPPPAVAKLPQPAKRAPLSVDVMSADGRLLGTMPCQFVG